MAAIKPFTGSLDVVNVLVAAQILGCELLRTRTLYVVNGANIAEIELDLDLTDLVIAFTESVLNSYSKLALAGEILLFNKILTCVPVTETFVIFRVGVGAA